MVDNKEPPPGPKEPSRGVEVEETSDLAGFLNTFYESELFNQGILKRRDGVSLTGFSQYKEAVLARTVDSDEEFTDDEIKSSFLETDQAKQLLLNFAREELRLVFDQSNYPPEVVSAYGAYRNWVKEIKSPRAQAKMAGLASTQDWQDLMRQMDQARQFRHSKSADSLISVGYTPSLRIARAITRIFMVSEGLDTFDHIQRDETERFRNLAQVTS